MSKTNLRDEATWARREAARTQVSRAELAIGVACRGTGLLGIGVYYWGRKVYQMALNIKNDETQKLTKALAKLTGESMTAAITEAVRERLERIRGEQGTNLADRLVKIGKDCAAHLQEPYRSVNHGELLYNEKGLPR